MTTGDGFIERLERSFGADGPPAEGSCPAAAALWDAYHGAADAAARSAVVDHLAVCAACAADWVVLREGPATAAAPRAARVRARAWTTLLAAAAAVFAVAIAVAVLRGPAPPAALRTVPELELSALTAPGALARDHALLRWSDLGPGARYTLDVTTEGLARLVTARGLDVHEYVVPPAALASVPPGAVLLWRVEAVLPDGRRVASPGFRARLE